MCSQCERYGLNLHGDDLSSAVLGGDGPYAFVDADSRVGTVAGKKSLTVPEAALQLLRSEPGWSNQFLVPATVTYAFRETAPASMPTDTGGFSQFNAAQIIQAEKALQSWSDVANIKFVRVGEGTSGPEAYSNSASILFANFSTGSDGSAGFAYYPGNTAVSSRAGDIWIKSTSGYNTNPTAANYGGMVLVHEIGHAIGLAHPSEYNASADETLTYAKDATYYQDSRQYTVMSYFGEANTGGSFSGAYASSPLLDDIAAAQLAYGANMTTRTGDTVYGFNSTADREWFLATSSSSRLVFAVWDAGGVDTLDFSGYRVVQTIDLRSGYFSSVGGLKGNVTIAMNAVIENAIGGSAADTINGNAVGNRLTGGAGADILDGGGGVDTAVFAGAFKNYTITARPEGAWSVQDRAGGDGTDSLLNIEFLAFADRTVAIVDSRVAAAINNILRLKTFSASADSLTKSLAAAMAEGTSYADAVLEVSHAASSTSAVAVLSYQFFTGRTPTAAGMDYLVNPEGGNANNLNSAYYQAFSLENRYINFAVNLGKIGEGAAKFAADYGALSLFDATRKAYASIFGLTPTDEKVRAVLEGRSDYFAAYGQDGPNGQGTKAAMVGWLMAEAVKADVGVYAKSVAAFFADQITLDGFGVDLIGVYAKPEYNLT